VPGLCLGRRGRDESTNRLDLRKEDGACCISSKEERPADLIKATLTAALAGLILGIDMVVISGIIDSVVRVYGLSGWGKGVTMDMSPVGTVLGCFAADLGARTNELPVCRIRLRRTTCRRHVQPDRIGQTQRTRSGTLSPHRVGPDRRPSNQPHRRTPALESLPACIDPIPAGRLNTLIRCPRRR